MTQPTPPYTQADIDLVAATFIAEAKKNPVDTTASPLLGGVQTRMLLGPNEHDIARSVLDALAAAGRLTTSGRCGTALTPIGSNDTTGRPVCSLTDGHTGWHRADNGAEWGETQDDINPPAPHVTEWLRQAAANHTPGRPDDIHQIYARATGATVRTEYGVRLHWDSGTVEDLPRDNRRDALLTVAMHAQRRAAHPGWSATAVLIERTVAVSPWTETTEEPA